MHVTKIFANESTFYTVIKTLNAEFRNTLRQVHQKWRDIDIELFSQMNTSNAWPTLCS